MIAHTSYHGYEGIATDMNERERLVCDLGEANILVLRNHGLLTVGRTVAEAFVWMYRAERACRMQLAFQSSGAEATEPSPSPVTAWPTAPRATAPSVCWNGRRF